MSAGDAAVAAPAGRSAAPAPRRPAPDPPTGAEQPRRDEDEAEALPGAEASPLWRGREPADLGARPWQRFVVRVTDERGDSVPDHHTELFTRGPGADRRAVDFDADAHAYRADPGFRCFHVSRGKPLKDRGGAVPDLRVRLVASSGSGLVGRYGIDNNPVRADGTGMDPEGARDAGLPLPGTSGDQGVRLFRPFTTTSVEVALNRDPMPSATGPNRVCVSGLDWKGWWVTGWARAERHGFRAAVGGRWFPVAPVPEVRPRLAAARPSNSSERRCAPDHAGRRGATARLARSRKPAGPAGRPTRLTLGRNGEQRRQRR